LDTKADVAEENQTDLVAENQHSLPVEIRHQSRCCSERSNRFGDTKLTLTACRDQTPKQALLSKTDFVKNKINTHKL